MTNVANVVRIIRTKAAAAAGKQFYEYPNKPDPASEDLLLLSDEQNPGHLTKNTTVQQMTATIQNLLSVVGTVCYVSSTGSNSANGSITAPWATVEHALTQITSATPDNPYCIKLLSDVSAGTVALKPCVGFDLSGFTLTISQLTLDASWGNVFSGALSLYVTHGIIKLSDTAVLNFTSYLAQTALLSFSDLLITQPIEFVGNGVQTVNLKDVGNVTGSLNIKIQDFSGAALSGGIAGNLDIINTTVSDGMTVFVVGEVLTGDITLTSATHPLVGFLIGMMSFSQVFGDGPQVVVYTSATLVQYPTMSNGAHWYPIQLNSLQNTLYVTSYGSDSQGDGSAINAYSTVTGALTSQRVPGATPENPVDIIVFGESNDTAIPALPPNVNIIGFNAFTPQYVEINSTAWQSASPGSKNVIAGFNSPGFFCNCISPAETPNLVLKSTEFSVGYFANCTLSISDSKTVNNPSTSNLITFQSVMGESINNTYLSTEFLIQNGAINFKNDQFSQNIKTLQNTAAVSYLNCNTSTVTINASDTVVIKADRNFSAYVSLSGDASLSPIANTIDYGPRVDLFSSYAMRLPVPFHVYVNMLSAGQSVTLPPCNSGGVPTIPVGTRIYFETSAGSFSYSINYNDGTAWGTINPGITLYLILNDNSTTNGVWDFIPVTQTVNGSYGMVKVGVTYTTAALAFVSMQANYIYINAYAGGQAVFQVPPSLPNKTVIGVYGVTGASTAGWTVNAASGQKFQLATDVGASGGSLTSTTGSFGDGFQAVYDLASSTWVVTTAIGNNLTVA